MDPIRQERSRHPPVNRFKKKSLGVKEEKQRLRKSIRRMTITSLPKVAPSKRSNLRHLCDKKVKWYRQMKTRYLPGSVMTTIQRMATSSAGRQPATRRRQNRTAKSSTSQRKHIKQMTCLGRNQSTMKPRTTRHSKSKDGKRHWFLNPIRLMKKNRRRRRAKS